MDDDKTQGDVSSTPREGVHVWISGPSHCKHLSSWPVRGTALSEADVGMWLSAEEFEELVTMQVERKPEINK